jgi:hypothetical protein
VLRARQIEAATVHNHLHLHGVTPETAALTSSWKDYPE